MEINIVKLIQMSTPVLKGFKRIEPRDWGIEGTLLELGVEIGALGRALTIWENYRHGRKSRHQLSDELSDILFVLVKLIKDRHLIVQYNLTSKNIESPEQAFFRLQDLAVELRHVITNEAADVTAVRERIHEMISIVGGLGEYYQISLEKAHLAEIKSAALWQKLFFTSEGKKINHFLLPRKAIWLFLGWWHQRKLDH